MRLRRFLVSLMLLALFAFVGLVLYDVITRGEAVVPAAIEPLPTNTQIAIPTLTLPPFVSDVETAETSVPPTATNPPNFTPLPPTPTRLILPTVTPDAALPTAIPPTEPLPTPLPPEPTSSPELVHIMQAGERLEDVAALYGISADALAGFNGFSSPNVALQAGFALKIPTE